MHHEGFVEAIAVQLPGTAVLHMDHRSLAEGRQQLVGRMRAEHQRAVGAARSAHGVAPAEELVKRRIGIPGLVEVQHLDTAAQFLLDQLGVVAQPVVGGIGHHRQLDLGRATPGQRIGLDLGLDRYRAELTQRDRPDDAQLVAFGAQVQGDGPGHDDRVDHRLVAVAVHQHQVITADHRVPDDLVGGRSAVDHEESMVGAEVLCRPRLGSCQGPGVVEQRAQLRDRYRQVRAQGVLAEELVKGLADRAFAIGHATAMAGSVP
ncbi:hypothetical protein D9M71_498820 [compost metagenome]